MIIGTVGLIATILWIWERLMEKRVAEDEIVGWHQWFNGHGLGQPVGDGEGQGGLACCSPWSPKESYTTGQLNQQDVFLIFLVFILCFPFPFFFCFLWISLSTLYNWNIVSSLTISIIQLYYLNFFNSFFRVWNK